MTYLEAWLALAKEYVLYEYSFETAHNLLVYAALNLAEGF